MIKIIKKDGSMQVFDRTKIESAVNKSAERVLKKLSKQDFDKIIDFVKDNIGDSSVVEVAKLHNIVEMAIETIDKKVASSYREYRNYKVNFVNMMDEIYRKSCDLRYRGDRENSNRDSALVSTKRSLVYGELNKTLYQKFFLTEEERQAVSEGFIYIHDASDRLNTYNCCLFDAGAVMTGGFEMGSVRYTEPKSILTACEVLGDIMFMVSAQQYGGNSISEVDKLLAPYVEKTYNKYLKEFEVMSAEMLTGFIGRQSSKSNHREIIEKWALKKTLKDLEQGIQGIEVKANSVACGRGDFPFLTFTFGENVHNKWSNYVTSAILKVRREGQGEEGKKQIMPFPKLIFLYNEEYHGEGKEFEYLYDEAILCSSKAMYPDFLSLTGEGYIPSIYKKYGKIISLMGCRASLSPYFERGGFEPADETDVPVFIGRANLGAVSLHLPLIYQEAKVTGKDFYVLLDYYLEMIRKIHIRTYDYLGEMTASMNPLGFCEGGFWGGNLNPEDKIAPVIKSWTASFGITALNELQILHNGKSLVEDNSFAIEVMRYINDKVVKYKEEDGKLYAIYGTPAESLVGTQVKQFRKRFGIIKDVSDREYVSNSFHCNVREDITPVEKQDKENEFWDLFNGGKIQYVKYPLGYNTLAIKTLVRRAMKLGLYEGVNLDLSFCNNCGHSEDGMKICSNCGSDDVNMINRMNGYLSYSKLKGNSRLNDNKLYEIADRKSM